jgi:hypothetical protein
MIEFRIQKELIAHPCSLDYASRLEPVGLGGAALVEERPNNSVRLLPAAYVAVRSLHDP